MNLATTTKTPAGPPVRSTDLVRLPHECERRYCSHHDGAPDDCWTSTFLRNMEAIDGDHWRVELSLERWRSAQELADYLRWAANSVALLQAQPPGETVERRKDSR